VVAVDLDPEFGWFRLELGLLDLYENRHKDAAQRFDEAAERTDDPVLRTAIEAMRAEVAGAAP
jgi:hypothetical protein